MHEIDIIRIKYTMKLSFGSYLIFTVLDKNMLLFIECFNALIHSNAKVDKNAFDCFKYLISLCKNQSRSFLEDWYLENELLTITMAKIFSRVLWQADVHAYVQHAFIISWVHFPTILTSFLRFFHIIKYKITLMYYLIPK